METQIDRGFMNIYIHETCHVDRRLVYSVIRFPYVRYDRRRFRKYFIMDLKLSISFFFFV